MICRPATAAVSGHFGELLQGRLGTDGPLVLVTLPAPDLRVTVRFTPGPFALHCAGGERAIRPAQAAAICRALTGRPGGRLRVSSDAPAGGGAGSSTAALLAVAAACAGASGRALPPPEALARLCHTLEGATDPLMHPAPERLLWAPRAARALAVLPPLPPLQVIGGFLGRGQPTDPADLDFADVGDLAAAWPAAAARGDLAALAALSTESARRNAVRRGGPPIEPLLARARRSGALGVAAAHTGSARALIFAPGAAIGESTLAALRDLGLRRLHRFRLAGPVRGR
ncbi:MAG: propanediol utilization protein [Amaricoccus sp.]